jgi:hypothetical protein
LPGNQRLETLDAGGNGIGGPTAAGKLCESPSLCSLPSPTGYDYAIWFVENGAGKIGRLQ